MLITVLFIILINTDAQPAGTIMAYAGTQESLKRLEAQGWILCDGQLYDRTTQKYRNLFAAIGTSWGGDGGNRFAVPDLRGLFLRGVADTTSADPDANNRLKSRPDLNSSGNGGNAVGSKQEDITGRHEHTITDPGHAHTYAKGGSTIDTWGSRPPATGQLGCLHCNDKLTTDNQKTGITKTDEWPGSETRPKNAYVYYIIKL